jgi:small subunit ribosomal protein S27e
VECVMLRPWGQFLPRRRALAVRSGRTELIAPGQAPYVLTALPPCLRSTTVFSHAQTVVICGGCSTVLCQPTGGKARLTEGCSFRKKVE